jgi:glycerate kinase
MGMAQALGAKFLDRYGRELGLGSGQALIKIDKIDVSGLDKRVGRTEFLVSSDVQNPLTGPDGAAYIYAPQKGATPEMVEALDEELAHYAEIIKRDLGIDIKDVPGSGAAGGLGAGLMVFLGAELKSGVDLIMEAVGFEEKLKEADLVITGEGKIDAQTAYGKVPVGVAKMAKAKGIPVVAISGQVTEDAKILHDYGLTKMYSLIGPGVSVEDAIKNAAKLIEETAAQLLPSPGPSHS